MEKLEEGQGEVITMDTTCGPSETGEGGDEQEGAEVERTLPTAYCWVGPEPRLVNGEAGAGLLLQVPGPRP